MAFLRVFNDARNDIIGEIISFFYRLKKTSLWMITKNTLLPKTELIQDTICHVSVLESMKKLSLFWKRNLISIREKLRDHIASSPASVSLIFKRERLLFKQEPEFFISLSFLKFVKKILSKSVFLCIIYPCFSFSICSKL